MSSSHPTLPPDEQFRDVPPLASHPDPEPSGAEAPDRNLRTDPGRGVGEQGTEGTDPSWLILPEDDEEPTKSPALDTEADDPNESN